MSKETITYDANAGDLNAVAEQIDMANRLGVKWNVQFCMVPFHAYGAEWVARDKTTGALRAMVFFEPGKEGDPFEVRASRLVKASDMAHRLQTGLTIILLRGKDTRWVKIPPGDSIESPAELFVKEIRAGVFDVMIPIQESLLKSFTKGEESK